MSLNILLPWNVLGKRESYGNQLQANQGMLPPFTPFGNLCIRCRWSDPSFLVFTRSEVSNVGAYGTNSRYWNKGNKRFCSFPFFELSSNSTSSESLVTNLLFPQVDLQLQFSSFKILHPLPASEHPSTLPNAEDRRPIYALRKISPWLSAHLADETCNQHLRNPALREPKQPPPAPISRDNIIRLIKPSPTQSRRFEVQEYFFFQDGKE